MAQRERGGPIRRREAVEGPWDNRGARSARPGTTAGRPRRPKDPPGLVGYVTQLGLGTLLALRSARRETPHGSRS
jgi:hypothetical protein